MAKFGSPAVLASMSRNYNQSRVQNKYRVFKWTKPSRNDYEEIVDIPNSEKTEETHHLLGLRKKDPCPSGFCEALLIFLPILITIVLIAVIQKYYSGNLLWD